MEDAYGPLVTPEDVLQAAISTLEAWMPEYLSSLESKHGLPANSLQPPRVYHGGIDDGSWIGEVLPEVMLLVSPLGEAERPQYVQPYLIDAKVVCIGQQAERRAEDEARVQASYLGGALMLLVQQPSLGGLATDLVMTGSPTVSLPDSDNRAIVQATARFVAYVGPIITLEGPKGTVPQQAPEGPAGEQLGPPVAPTYTAEKASIAVEAKA